MRESNTVYGFVLRAVGRRDAIVAACMLATHCGMVEVIVLAQGEGLDHRMSAR
jgi:hypothetical protein